MLNLHILQTLNHTNVVIYFLLYCVDILLLYLRTREGSVN